MTTGIKSKAVIYIRSFETLESVRDIDVTSMLGTTNYSRCLSGIFRKTDLNRFFVDSEKADQMHEESMKAQAGA